MSNQAITHPASYRDPSGFIFLKDGVVYRQVNLNFKEHFDLFIKSGLYDHLVKKELLIPHEELEENLSGDPECYATLKPQIIQFLSYPYEWSFDMLKDAALLTLRSAKESISHGLILKDATPYNIQWHNGKLVFIDSLSFEKYNEDEPWIAYRQFCENFLGPLLLMHYKKLPLHELLFAWPDGIPLHIIKSLLPLRSKFSLHTYLHIHMHARLSSAKNNAPKKNILFSKKKMFRLLESLEGLVRSLRLSEKKTAWSHYYREASQRNDYLEVKKKIIQQWIEKSNDMKTALDLGANEGMFSKLLSGKNINVIAADADPYCINRLYLDIKKNAEKNIHPFIIDLSHPSPSMGVNNEERTSFIERTKVDLAMALALIHHLVIGKNIPFEMIADCFARLGKNLIVEFVPKEDEKVQLLLSHKKDIYTNYSEIHFIKAFEKRFAVVDRQMIPGTDRTLFLMKRHND